jgi:Tol biopolymer transport system component
MSSDGRYVAFQSTANDLVDGDNAATDVFVRDAAAGATRRASVDLNGDSPNGASTAAALNGDGSVVAFSSVASDLVAPDGNTVADVFIRNLETRTTTRVSVDTTGGPPNGASTAPSISADGTRVAFVSTATDLVTPDPNGATADVFVRDLLTGTTTRIGGTAGGQATNAPAISRGGRYVAVVSRAALVAGDTNNLNDIYRFDLQTSTFARVSVDTGGGPANGASAAPSISSDGTRVAYESAASDLVANDTNPAADVFVRNLTSNTTTIVSRDTAAGPANGASTKPALTADGMRVAFLSAATDLVAGDGNGVVDVFLRSVSGGPTTRLSLDSAAGDPNGASSAVTVDRDGRYVAYATAASDIVTTDTNGASDVFLLERTGIPRVTVSDVTVTEGNGGSATLRFTITLEAPQGSLVALPWQTQNGTAIAPGDYTAASGTANIVAGSTSAQVSVSISGDSVIEPDERFVLSVGGTSGIATIDPTGTAVIRGDDRP